MAAATMLGEERQLGIRGDVEKVAESICPSRVVESTLDATNQFAALVAQTRYKRLQLEEVVIETYGAVQSPSRVTVVKSEPRWPALGGHRLRFTAVRDQWSAKLQNITDKIGEQLEPNDNLGAIKAHKRSVKRSGSPVKGRSDGELHKPLQQAAVDQDDKKNTEQQVATCTEEGDRQLGTHTAESECADDTVVSDQQAETTTTPVPCSPPDATPLTYEWPVEGAEMLYEQHRSYNTSGSVSPASILSAPPPVTAAIEAAESLLNMAAAGISSLSLSSKLFFDRSSANLKDAAAKGQNSWQQTFSKVSRALQVSKAPASADDSHASSQYDDDEDSHTSEDAEGERGTQFFQRATSFSMSMRKGLAGAMQQAKEALRDL